MRESLPPRLRRVNPSKHWSWPAMTLMALTGVLPFVFAVVLSFSDASMLVDSTRWQWTGGQAYRTAWSWQPGLPIALARSLAFAVVVATLEVGASLVAGTLLARQLIGRPWLFASLLFASLLPPMIVGLTWKYLLQPDYGAIPHLLRAIGATGSATVLLGNTHVAWVMLGLIDIWQWTPFVTVVIGSVHATAPRRSAELTLLDGAGRWRRARDVVLPRLLPVASVLAAIRFVVALKTFEVVEVVTGGGPGFDTEMFGQYLWRLMFREWNVAAASAGAVIGYLLVFGMSGAILLFVLKRDSDRTRTQS